MSAEPEFVRIFSCHRETWLVSITFDGNTNVNGQPIYNLKWSTEEAEAGVFVKPEGRLLSVLLDIFDACFDAVTFDDWIQQQETAGAKYCS